MSRKTVLLFIMSLLFLNLSLFAQEGTDAKDTDFDTLENDESELNDDAAPTASTEGGKPAAMDTVNLENKQEPVKEESIEMPKEEAVKETPKKETRKAKVKAKAKEKKKVAKKGAAVKKVAKKDGKKPAKKVAMKKAAKAKSKKAAKKAKKA